VFPWDVNQKSHYQFNAEIKAGKYDLAKELISFALSEPDLYKQNISPAYELTLTNSAATQEVKYTVDSVDILLGVIGGFSGLIWSSMAFCVSGYESFREETTKLESFYTSHTNIKSDYIDDSTSHQNEPEASIFDRATDAVKNRKKYDYKYSDFYLAWFL
jgi:hypothetical protein